MTVDDEYGPLEPVPVGDVELPEQYSPEPLPPEPDGVRTEVVDDETVDDDALVEFNAYFPPAGFSEEPTDGPYRYKIVEKPRVSGPVLALYYYDDIGHVKPHWSKKGEYPDDLYERDTRMVEHVLAQIGHPTNPA